MSKKKKLSKLESDIVNLAGVEDSLKAVLIGILRKAEAKAPVIKEEPKTPEKAAKGKFVLTNNGYELQ